MNRRSSPVLTLAVSALLVAGCAPQVLSDTSPLSPPTGTGGAADGSVEVVDTVATEIPVPWGLVELPDGTALITSRDEHHVYRVAPNDGKVVDLGEIPGVDSDTGDGGLLGVAVSRYYTSSKRIYLYYSTRVDNRIAYVTLRPGSPATLSQPTVVFTAIPRGLRHNAGRITFGTDGMLYVGTGDTRVPALAQDAGSLGGKVLRMTPGGEPAPGNPTPRSVVFSSGHRNIQGLAFDSEGRLFASELGDTRPDELNWIRRGHDYGWPEDLGSTAPVATFGADEDSPSGVAVAGGSAYLVTLHGEQLWRIPVDDTELVAEPRAFLTHRFGRLRSVLALSDKVLLLSTSNTDNSPGAKAVSSTARRLDDDRLLLVRVS